MAHKSFQVKSFITYWLDSVGEHSLHSPFFYDFYTRVVKSKSSCIQQIETLRKKLLSDDRHIQVEDLGSQSHLRGKRKISSIARHHVTPVKFSALYLRILRHYDLNNVIELGTSLGINTLYLAAKEGSHVTTFEGAHELVNIANLTFNFAHASNINIVSGNIDTTLSTQLQSLKKVEFALLDANHRYKPTLKYFESLLARLYERSVVVIDDIHYSSEMEKAWNEIKNHKLVYASADLYRCGILFFDPSLNKQHVILQF